MKTMRNGVVGVSLLCVFNLVCAAPPQQHQLFESRFPFWEEGAWDMGCSLFGSTASSYIEVGGQRVDWFRQECFIVGPNGAGIHSFGVDLPASSSAHFASGSPSPDSYDGSAAWDYTGATSVSTGMNTYYYYTSGGGVLFDSLNIKYDFWYRMTGGGAKISVYDDDITQLNRYGNIVPL